MDGLAQPGLVGAKSAHVGRRVTISPLSASSAALAGLDRAVARDPQLAERLDDRAGRVGGRGTCVHCRGQPADGRTRGSVVGGSDSRPALSRSHSRYPHGTGGCRRVQIAAEGCGIPFRRLCRRFGSAEGSGPSRGTAVVRKGSPVRVRQRALREVPAVAGTSCVKGACLRASPGSPLGPESGPSGSLRVPSRHEFTDCGRRGRLAGMTRQLELPSPAR